MNEQSDLQDKRIQKIHSKLVGGIREYMTMHGFKKTVIGLSGGVDSAVVCCLAEAAAGRENVLGISMPSRYSAPESNILAAILAENLGITFKSMAIDPVYDSYLEILEEHLGKSEEDSVEIHHQNIQARIRGNILMAFSNKYGHLVLATGNRSEAMMGYCTLYGDTVGGLAVISDLSKTDVYLLAEYINRDQEIIPTLTIEREPSAELKPGQKDRDSLPPYDVLDVILRLYLDEKVPRDGIVERGFDPGTVNEVLRAIETSEYKRRQCPQGIPLEDIR